MTTALLVAYLALAAAVLLRDPLARLREQAAMRTIPQAVEAPLRAHLHDTALLLLHSYRHQDTIGDAARGIELRLILPGPGRLIPVMPRLVVHILLTEQLFRLEIGALERIPGRRRSPLRWLRERQAAMANRRRIRNLCLKGVKPAMFTRLAAEHATGEVVVRVLYDRISAHDRLRFRQRLRACGIEEVSNLDPPPMSVTAAIR